MSWLSEATGIDVNLTKNPTKAEIKIGEKSLDQEFDKFLRKIGLKKEPKEEAVTETVGVESLIGSLEEETKKKEREKADLAARALMDTQSRLARERKPGMDTKNKTILTSPLGIPTSLLTEPKKQTLLGA